MTQARAQFHKTTEQYFYANHKVNPGINLDENFHSKSQTPVQEIRTFYIKEGPFVNHKDKK